jgi:hypothetical protein
VVTSRELAEWAQYYLLVDEEAAEAEAARMGVKLRKPNTRGL